MKPINFGRVILGGLLAGVIINVSEFLLHAMVLKKDFEDAMRSLNRTAEMGGGVFLVWILFGFAVGIGAVWLYAAIRPRYGPGPATAARAGIAVWFFGSFLTNIAMANMGLFESKLLVVPAIWAFVEEIVATNAGAWLYKEDAASA